MNDSVNESVRETVDVELRDGTVRGIRKGAGGVFRAIPFAAPPVGANRFLPPQPVVPWEGVRDATTVGPTAPQRGPSPVVGHLIPNTSAPGDDYLHLNVSTPDLGAGDGAPVLVFIYGGSFVTGSNALDLYDGAAFARDGIVYVAVNYRLGVDGFLKIDDAVPNRGLLDQVAALEWVRDNIARFGGDPERVTVMGESAGAMSIGTLLRMPAARGLFRRAVLQSGGAENLLTTASAELVRDRVSEILGVPPTVAALSALPVEDLLAAQDTLAAESAQGHDDPRWAQVDRHWLPFEPFADGQTVPVAPGPPDDWGWSSEVEILAGYTTEEMRLFVTAVPENGEPVRAAAAAYGSARGLTGEGLADYRRISEAGGSDLDVYTAIGTDAVFRIPLRKICDSPGVRYLYGFGWQSPADDGSLRAAHAFELPFVFDALDSPDAVGILAGEHPQDLADRMHAAWVAFVTHGDPGWASYGDDPVEHRFSTVDETVTDPFADLDRRWAGAADPA